MIQWKQVLTMSLVTGSLLLRREVTTSTMASRSFGNLNSSCRGKKKKFHHEHNNFVCLQHTPVFYLLIDVYVIDRVLTLFPIIKFKHFSSFFKVNRSTFPASNFGAVCLCAPFSIELCNHCTQCSLCEGEQSKILCS